MKLEPSAGWSHLHGHKTIYTRALAISGFSGALYVAPNNIKRFRWESTVRETY